MKSSYRLNLSARIIAAVSSFALLLCARSLQPVYSLDGETSDWPAYGRDQGGSRYSSLSEINRDNVNRLKIAWTYRTGEIDVKSRSANKAAFEATPILVDGTLYLSTPYNLVIALNPETGEERWRYDAKIDVSAGYSEVTSRGVSYWRDDSPKSSDNCSRRIYIATLDAQLISLDAATGTPCKEFGQDGRVDLTRDVRIIDREDYQVTSPPAVIGDLIVVGSSIGDNRGAELERGVVRAYEARTGKLRWSWDPLPQNGSEAAGKSRHKKRAVRTGAANAWSIISTDPKRGLIFIPTSSPSPDFYGGERPGDNLFANSVVALRASTGKAVWHFQVVHHDLWDYDIASQPMLIDIKRKGRTIPAVAVGTKMGNIFILHRETGQPLFPVVERPVPKSDVAGETASPTQPFPKLPLPIVPHKLSPEDAWGPTPSDRDWCKERIKSLRSEGIFTPPSLEGTIAFPGNVGGLHWGGMSYDPARQILIANTNRLAFVIKLIPRAEYEKQRSTNAANRLGSEFGRQEGTPYGMYREPLLGPSGAPCNPPPWGALTAIDLATGEQRWESPLGTFPPAAKLPIASTLGSINLGGSIATGGGLVFIAAGMDDNIRAFDIETGKELWKGELPAGGQATPMTYRASKNGKQYVVISAGGHGKLGTKKGDYVVAFALP